MSEERGLEDRLSDLASVHGEADIAGLLREVLAETSGGDWRQGVQTGSGPADLVCHEYRVIIETKTRGQAEPTWPGSQVDETQFDQVARYMEALQTRLGLGNNRRPWRGFLTDGICWWGWEWRADRPHPILEVQNFRPVLEPAGFRNVVAEYLAPDERRGKPAPPDPLRPLFAPYLKELKEMLLDVETEPFFTTKLELWKQTLRGSGLLGEGSVARAHNFVEHTALVIAARLIVNATDTGVTDVDEDSLVNEVGDGFSAWLVDFPAGRALLNRLAHSVARYDWSAAGRDLLKGLYHDLIDREDRKEFGEYYTPDWLAERLVEKVLMRDTTALDEAIRSCAQSLGLSPNSRAGAGPAFFLLDPACGSGTFLFYLAKVVESRIRQAHPLLEEHTRQICAHMVVGMDVHPIAVEMAKATLATALPPGPTRPFLQVFLADSMLAHRAARVRLDETMRLPTTKPDGELLIPQELVESPHAAQLIDQLVEAATAAAEGKEDPQSEYPELPGELLDQLTEVVRTEGDHVWKWYIGNNVAPIRLASGAAAIIGNPPWLVVNDTPEGIRKAQIAELAADYRLRPRNTGSARGDLAALFSARVVDLYLIEGGRFGFVLPGSAVIAQTWKAWRVGNWGAATVRFDLHETYDDMSDPPFPHAPNGACIVSGSRNTSSQDPGDWTKAEPLRVSGTPALIRTVRWVQRAPQPSPYATRFTRGAVASPLGLVLVVTPPAPGPYTGTVKVTTMASTKGKWKGVQYSNVIVEKACLLPALRSQTLRPFVCEPDAWFIAPHAENMGKFRILELDDPKFPERYGHGLEYWRRAEETYAQHRAETAGETLSQNLDRYRTLTKQLGTDFEPGAAEDPPYSKVFYNKSGNTLRACRGSRNLLADDKLYWYVASDPSEALYLCAVLNAEWTQEAWRESKTSKMHYDLNPLKHVPVPLYDRSDPLHANIVRLAREAEQSPDASRDSLEQEVARLLPEWGPIH